MKRIKLYTVNLNYIRYLSKGDNRIMNDGSTRKRIYLGLFNITNSKIKYVIPLSSPKKGIDYYIDNNGNANILQHNSNLYHYIESVSKNGNYEIIGKVMLANMIPAPSSELKEVTIKNIKDQQYKRLVLKQYNYLKHFYSIFESLIKMNYKRYEQNIKKNKTSGTFINYGLMEVMADKWDTRRKLDKLKCNELIQKLENLNFDEKIILSMKNDVKRGLFYKRIKEKFEYGEYIEEQVKIK